jgi:hypothetical protein
VVPVETEHSLQEHPSGHLWAAPKQKKE